MNPEPSERLSGRPGPRSGPCPGGWRGTKRRKNSITSSSSIPGTCGKALRRAAWVVLMLTTELPCSSTNRVKSGSSRAWAKTLRQKAASQRPARDLTARIGESPISWLRCVPALLRTAELDGIGNALHARRRRFPDHGNHVLRHFLGIDMDGAHARQPRPHRVAAPFQRLDEHGHRRQAVRVNDLADRACLAQAALELGDFAEARQFARQPPPAQAGRDCLGVLHPPALRGVPRLYLVA